MIISGACPEGRYKKEIKMKKSFFIRAALIVLAASLVCSIAGCKSDEDTAIDRKHEIIEEICVDHATYGTDADSRVRELLGELEGEDADSAAKWTKIVELWKECEGGVELNYDVLPDGLPDTDELCLVVLGFQLEPDGTMKDELIERLTVAKTCAEKYPNAYVACTGGGTASGDESATEAGAMSEWLIENGVDKARVITEDRSLTTAQNAQYTFEILMKEYPQVKKIAIVSSDYHIATGVLLFGAQSILLSDANGNERYEIVSNAAWKAPKGELTAMFQAGALIELSGDTKTAFDIYYENYDIHELPPLDTSDSKK